jgi:hypothetical protein
MDNLGGLALLIGFAIVWLLAVCGFAYWVLAKELPRLVGAMKKSGMSDEEISKKMINVAFPPRFHK